MERILFLPRTPTLILCRLEAVHRVSHATAKRVDLFRTEVLLPWLVTWRQINIGASHSVIIVVNNIHLVFVISTELAEFGRAFILLCIIIHTFSHRPPPFLRFALPPHAWLVIVVLRLHRDHLLIVVDCAADLL